MIQFQPRKGQAYDACLVCQTSSQCNLDCVYCWVVDSRKIVHNEFKSRKVDTKTVQSADVYTDLIKRRSDFTIDVDALMKVMDQTGEVFHVVFTGSGEPLFVPNIVEACVEVSKKHYVSLFTNLTSSRIQDFCSHMDPDRVIAVVASLHIKELEKHRLTDKYIDNFLLCRKKGFFVFADEIAHPSLADQAEYYREFFRKQGIELHFSTFGGKYQGKFYPIEYSSEEIKAFNLTPADIQRHYQMGKICNAGYNIGVVSISGKISTCQYIHDDIGNINNKILFRDRPIVCPLEMCGCPLNVYDPGLFRASLEAKVGLFVREHEKDKIFDQGGITQ